MSKTFFDIKGLYIKNLCKGTNYYNLLQILCPFDKNVFFSILLFSFGRNKNIIQSVVNAFVMCMYCLFSFKRENRNSILVKNY